MKKPIKYLYEIDGHFLRCKLKKVSRLSMDWGGWSAEMNREIRERVENDDPDTLMLKYIYMYWVLRSQHLELIHKTRGLFGKGKIRRKNNECKEVRNIIVNGVDADPLGLKIESGWANFVARFSGR